MVVEWQDNYEVYATGRTDFPENPTINFMTFDLAEDSYDKLVEWAEPQVIIHCAALTNVDYCEEHPEQAMAVNGESVKKLLHSAGNARIILISTDAVFSDGLHMATEKHQANPQNIYGKSKAAGEQYLLDAESNHCVVRTTIVGKNSNSSKQGFVEWIVNSVSNGKVIKLFDDALFTPITIWHLADELEWIIENDISGIIHIAGKEPVSKYDFGYRICKGLGLDMSWIIKGSIDNATFKAKRAKDLTLDSTYYETVSGRKLPSKEDVVHSIVTNFEDYAYG